MVVHRCHDGVYMNLLTGMQNQRHAATGMRTVVGQRLLQHLDPFARLEDQAVNALSDAAGFGGLQHRLSRGVQRGHAKPVVERNDARTEIVENDLILFHPVPALNPGPAEAHPCGPTAACDLPLVTSHSKNGASVVTHGGKHAACLHSVHGK